jgi:hypothetical protein
MLVGATFWLVWSNSVYKGLCSVSIDDTPRCYGQYLHIYFRVWQLTFFWLTSIFGTEGTEHLRFAGFVVGTGSRAGVTRQPLASVSTHTPCTKCYQNMHKHDELLAIKPNYFLTECPLSLLNKESIELETH